MNVDSLLVCAPVGCPCFSWSTGYRWPHRSTLDLIRENPIAFFNRYYLEGQLELAEYVLTQYCNTTELLAFLHKQGEVARANWVREIIGVP